MALGLYVFHTGTYRLEGKGEAPDLTRLYKKYLGPLRQIDLVWASCVLALLPLWWLVQAGDVVGNLLGITGGLMIAGLALYAVLKLDKVDRNRIFAILLLVPASVMFWAFFEQTGSSITLFAARGVDLEMFGWSFPVPWIQSINPLFIMIFAVPFAWLWVALDKRGFNPSLPSKFSLALLQMGLGFYMFFLGIESAANGEKVAFLWLVLGYLFHTTGELCLSPVGLSAVTKLSVPKIVGLVMGVWFLANAFANYAAGLIAMPASVDTVPGEDVPVEQALPLYGQLFESVAWVAVGTGLVLFVVSPLIRRLMHGVK